MTSLHDRLAEIEARPAMDSRGMTPRDHALNDLRWLISEVRRLTSETQDAYAFGKGEIARLEAELAGHKHNVAVLDKANTELKAELREAKAQVDSETAIYDVVVTERDAALAELKTQTEEYDTLAIFFEQFGDLSCCYAASDVVKLGQNALDEALARETALENEVFNLKMVCRRLSAAMSLETRDKIAAQCLSLFEGSPLRSREGG
jgi:chromosome segregation ATPase